MSFGALGFRELSELPSSLKFKKVYIRDPMCMMFRFYFFKFLFYKIVLAKIGNILEWQILLLWVPNWMLLNVIRWNCLKMNIRCLLSHTNLYLTKHLYHPQTFTCLRSISVVHVIHTHLKWSTGHLHQYKNIISLIWVIWPLLKYLYQMDEGQRFSDKSYITHITQYLKCA